MLHKVGVCSFYGQAFLPDICVLNSEMHPYTVVSGVLVGKPMDEIYAQEYRQLLTEVIDRPDLSIVFNLNIGHAMPRCIIPFGVEAVVDVENQIILVI